MFYGLCLDPTLEWGRGECHDDDDQGEKWNCTGEEKRWGHSRGEMEIT